MRDSEPDLVRVAAWAAIAGLRHGFTGRAGGVSTVYSRPEDGRGELNLGFTAEDDPEAVRANRAAVLRAVGGERLALVRQVHSGKVVRVRAGDALAGEDGKAVNEADGMMTNAAGVLLGVQAADCVPVLVADTRLRIAGAFHAGWRGTAAGIVREGIAAMGREFGSRAEDMVVAIGPSIGRCCYAVGGELMRDFDEDLFEERDGRVFLDLWEANRRQALAAGVAAERISVVGECTACFAVGAGRRYFSHRADHGRTGRGMGMVGWE